MLFMPAYHRRASLAISMAIALASCGCTKPSSEEHASKSAAATPVATIPMSVPSNADRAVTAPAESALARWMRQLDRNGDGRVSRDEHADAASHTFDTMDADHDGKVTAAEMDAVRAGLYGADRTAASREIAQVDSDHDGMLSAPEHATATAVIFDQIDANHDGFLTLAELEAAETAEAARKTR